MGGGFNYKVQACTVPYDSHVPYVDNAKIKHFLHCKNFYWTGLAHCSQKMRSGKSFVTFQLKVK